MSNSRRLVPLSMKCLLALLVMALVSPTALADAHAAPTEQQVVVHLSHFTDDLHAASMALALATNLREGGAGVTLFLDLEGARLADRRGSGDLRWGKGPSIAERFETFIAKGGKVLLCSHCAASAGIGPKNLREGAKIARDGEVRTLFLEATKVIDY